MSSKERQNNSKDMFLQEKEDFNLENINEINELKKEKRKLSPKDDIAFKRIFGSLGSENIIKSLLESILETSIKDVDLDLKQEYLPEDVEEGRKNLLDIRVTFNDGTQAYIEMQRAFKRNIGTRSLFYWARAFAGQAKKGDTELESLKKTIGIWILDEGIYFPKNEEYHNKFKMKNENNEADSTFEPIELHFFELQKLRESGTMSLRSSRKVDFWMWFIDHTNERMINMGARSVKEIKEAVEKLKELQADPVVAELAFKEQLAEMDYNSDIKAARAEGKAEGEKFGRAEGERIGKIEIAKNMKEKGIEAEVIAELTGLSKDEVEKL